MPVNTLMQLLPRTNVFSRNQDLDKVNTERSDEMVDLPRGLVGDGPMIVFENNTVLFPGNLIEVEYWHTDTR